MFFVENWLRNVERELGLRELCCIFGVSKIVRQHLSSKPSLHDNKTMQQDNLNLDNNIDDTANDRDKNFGDCGTLRVEDRKDKDVMLSTANNLELFFRWHHR
jgi:hypothetical protein